MVDITLKKQKTIYTFDRVSVSNGDCMSIIDKLTKEGWKELQYVAHGSWGDCRCPEIMGSRPMTKEELRERDQAIAEDKRKKIRDLKKLAKVLKYEMVKNK